MGEIIANVINRLAKKNVLCRGFFLCFIRSTSIVRIDAIRTVAIKSKIDSLIGSDKPSSSVLVGRSASTRRGNDERMIGKS